jgi:O-antigen/teichoic acid export membrane protein
MWLRHDASWWALVLAIAALVLMVPANVVSNVLTPLLLNWFATWSNAALERRIAKLENQLAELEKNPAIDEAQEQILWGITTLRMMALSLSSALLLIFYVGLGMLVNPANPEFKHLTLTVYAILAVTFMGTLRLRYAHDFRYKHSPTLRMGLRKAIDDLKKLRRQ